MAETATEILQQIEALTARVQELEDVREIIDIYHHWDWSCTGGFNGHQAGDYQSILEDFDFESGTIEMARLHYPGTGPKGKEEVLQYWDYFHGDNGPVPVVYQTMIDPAVRVDGDTAILECNEILWLHYRGDAQPLFAIVKRYTDFLRGPDGWKITRTILEDGLWTRTGPFDPRTHLNDTTKYVPRPQVNTLRFERPTDRPKNIIRHGRD